MRWCEFESRWDGMRHALGGGLWLHRHVLHGQPMAHLISSDRALLFRAGELLGMPSELLQYKPLRDPDSGELVPAWHWDLLRGRLERALAMAGPTQPVSRGRPRPRG